MFFIFTKQNCSQCEILKKQLKNTLLDITYVDITGNTSIINELKSLNFKSLPLIFYSKKNLPIESLNIKDLEYIGNEFKSFKNV